MPPRRRPSVLRAATAAEIMAEMVAAGGWSSSCHRREKALDRLGRLVEQLAPCRHAAAAVGPQLAAPRAALAAAAGARDFAGYGTSRPDPAWPVPGARVALNFVLNIEEGSEPSVPDGDGLTEAGLTETASDVQGGGRDLGAESMFEHGARVGFWRSASGHLTRPFSSQRRRQLHCVCCVAAPR